MCINIFLSDTPAAVEQMRASVSLNQPAGVEGTPPTALPNEKQASLGSFEGGVLSMPVGWFNYTEACVLC